MKKLFFLFCLMFLVNINAMVVNGSSHKEQTKTELSCEDATITVSAYDTNFVYLSMKKEKSFLEFKNGVKFEIKSTDENFRGNSNMPSINFFDEVSEIPDNYLDTLKNVDSRKLKNEMFGNFNHEKNVLDKIIDQLPNNLKTEEQTDAFEFNLNQTEFNKIKNLLDKENYYKGYKVNVLDNYPPKLIALKKIEKSKYF